VINVALYSAGYHCNVARAEVKVCVVALSAIVNLHYGVWVITVSAILQVLLLIFLHNLWLQQFTSRNTSYFIF